jgi:hypothetical protein
LNTNEVDAFLLDAVGNAYSLRIRTAGAAARRRTIRIPLTFKSGFIVCHGVTRNVIIGAVGLHIVNRRLLFAVLFEGNRLAEERAVSQEDNFIAHLEFGNLLIFPVAGIKGVFARHLKMR